MCIVVFACGVRLVSIFRARNQDEGVCTRKEINSVALELHVLDGQRLSAGGTAVAINDDLSGNRLVGAINGDVNACLLVDDAVTRDVVEKFDGHVACHLMGCIEGCLEGHVLGLTYLGHIVRVTDGEVTFLICSGNAGFALCYKVCGNVFLRELLREVAAGDGNLTGSRLGNIFLNGTSINTISDIDRAVCCGAALSKYYRIGCGECVACQVNRCCRTSVLTDTITFGTFC